MSGNTSPSENVPLSPPAVAVQKRLNVSTPSSAASPHLRRPKKQSRVLHEVADANLDATAFMDTTSNFNSTGFLNASAVQDESSVKNVDVPNLDDTRLLFLSMTKSEVPGSLADELACVGQDDSPNAGNQENHTALHPADSNLEQSVWESTIVADQSILPQSRLPELHECDETDEPEGGAVAVDDELEKIYVEQGIKDMSISEKEQTFQFQGDAPGVFDATVAEADDSFDADEETVPEPKESEEKVQLVPIENEGEGVIEEHENSQEANVPAEGENEASDQSGEFVVEQLETVPQEAENVDTPTEADSEQRTMTTLQETETTEEVNETQCSEVVEQLEETQDPEMVTDSVSEPESEQRTMTTLEEDVAGEMEEGEDDDTLGEEEDIVTPVGEQEKGAECEKVDMGGMEPMERISTVAEVEPCNTQRSRSRSATNSRASRTPPSPILSQPPETPASDSAAPNMEEGNLQCSILDDGSTIGPTSTAYSRQKYADMDDSMISFLVHENKIYIEGDQKSAKEGDAQSESVDGLKVRISELEALVEKLNGELVSSKTASEANVSLAEQELSEMRQALVQLETKVREASEETFMKEHELNRAKRELEKKDMRLETIQDDHAKESEESQQKIVELQSELDRLKTDNQDRDESLSTIVQLQEKLALLESDGLQAKEAVALQTEKMSDLESENALLKRQVAQLSEDLAANGEKEKQMNQEMTANSAEVLRLTEKLKELEETSQEGQQTGEVDELQSQLHKMEIELEENKEKMSELTEKLQEKDNECQVLGEMKIDLETVTSKLAEAEKQLEDLQNKLTVAEESLTETRKELEATRSTETDVEAMTKELAYLKDSVANKEEHIAELQDMLDIMKQNEEKLAESELALNEVKSDLVAKEQENVELRDMMASLENNIGDVKVKAEMTDALTEALQEKETKIKELEQQVEESQKSSDALTEEILARNTELKGKCTEMSVMQSEIDLLKAAVVEKERELTGATSALEQLRSECQHFSSELASYKKDADEMCARASASNEEAANCKQALNDAAERISKLEEQLSAETVKYTKAAEEVEALKEDAVLTNEELEELHGEVERHVVVFTEKDEENERLMKKTEQLEGDLIEVKARLAEAQQQTAEASAHKYRLEAMEKMEESLKERVEEQKILIDTLRQAREADQKELSSFRARDASDNEVLNAAQVKIGILESAVKEGETRSVEYAEMISSLESTVVDLKNQLDASKKMEAMHNERNAAELEEKILALQTVLQERENEKNDLSRRIQQSEEQTRIKEVEAQRMIAEIDLLRTKAEEEPPKESKANTAELEHDNKRLRAEVERLGTLCDEFDDIEDELKKENFALLQELNRLKDAAAGKTTSGPSLLSALTKSVDPLTPDRPFDHQSPLVSADSAQQLPHQRALLSPAAPNFNQTVVSPDRVEQANRIAVTPSMNRTVGMDRTAGMDRLANETTMLDLDQSPSRKMNESVNKSKCAQQ